VRRVPRLHRGRAATPVPIVALMSVEHRVDGSSPFRGATPNQPFTRDRRPPTGGLRRSGPSIGTGVRPGAHASV